MLTPQFSRKYAALAMGAGYLCGYRNSTPVGDGTYDMGNDGKTGSVNSLVARDAFGFSLNYFTGDYNQINTTVNAFGLVNNNLPNPTDAIHCGADLFNGNIRAMVVNIPKIGNAQLYGYRYDQLNRIVALNTYSGVASTGNASVNLSTASQDYNERIKYDANGNILGYLRNGAGAVNGLAMDSLTYKYDYYTSGSIRQSYIPGVTTIPLGARITNRLNYVKDSLGGSYTEDIKDEPANNYTYDMIGNLTSDSKENIDVIEWTVYGKISHIHKTTDDINIFYTYDASGNRISKVFRKTVSGVTTTKTTYYVRDASGNVMSVYQSGETSMNDGDLTQSEIHLYGSSRLGIYNVNTDVQCIETPPELTTFIRGNKFFELSNHLGNVLATISDKKLPHTTNGTTIDYYNADVVTANDYTPFGMLMVGRKYTASSSIYRYGFNGKENDNEVKGEGNQIVYEVRMYDPRVGRLLSIDPLGKSYPWYTPYQFAGNDVIRCADLLGEQPGSKTGEWKDKPFIDGDKSFLVYDKTKHQIFDCHGITDPQTGQPWILADDGQGQGHYFYLVNDNGSQNTLQSYVENGQSVLYKGHFEKSETQNQREAKQGGQIADGIGMAVFGISAIIAAAPIAIEGSSFLPSVAEASVKLRAVSVVADYGSQVAGNYIGGQNGKDAWLGNINISSLALSAVNPVSGVKSLAFNSVAGSAFSSTMENGYDGLGGGKSMGTFAKESVASFVAGSLTLGTASKSNQLTGRLNHVNNALGSNDPLSKALQRNIAKTQAVGTTIGAVSGTAANAATQKK